MIPISQLNPELRPLFDKAIGDVAMRVAAQLGTMQALRAMPLPHAIAYLEAQDRPHIEIVARVLEKLQAIVEVLEAPLGNPHGR